MKDLVAVLIERHPFPKINIELHVFGVYIFAQQANGEKKPRKHALFFSIFNTSSNKYSNAQVASLHAGLLWLEDLVRAEFEKDKLLDHELKVINKTLIDEDVLFANLEVRRARADEQSALDAIVRTTKVSGARPNRRVP